MSAMSVEDIDEGGTGEPVGRQGFPPSPLLINLPLISNAKCKGIDNLHFPENGRSLNSLATIKAIAMCKECDGMEACRNFALENNERFGIWGGTTPMNRRFLRKMLGYA